MRLPNSPNDWVGPLSESWSLTRTRAPSGKSADNRAGFQRLVAEVSLNHVGIVLGLELSRLSRNNKDWHQLVDVCGIFNTLLCDQDGVYDSTDGNDRLLLGMKGAMSEFELVTLRNRLARGTRNKAERGELFVSVPLGYLKQASGDVIQEPDEQARGMVQLVFEKFAELGSAYAVLRYFTVNNLRLGFRRLRGERIGELEWRLRVGAENPEYSAASRLCGGLCVRLASGREKEPRNGAD